MNAGDDVWMNMHACGIGPARAETGKSQNQEDAVRRQMATLDANWEDLRAVLVEEQRMNGGGAAAHYEYLIARADYAGSTRTVQNDTVLGDRVLDGGKGHARGAVVCIPRRMLKEANDRRRLGMWSWSRTGSATG